MKHSISLELESVFTLVTANIKRNCPRQTNSNSNSSRKRQKLENIRIPIGYIDMSYPITDVLDTLRNALLSPSVIFPPPTTQKDQPDRSPEPSIPDNLLNFDFRDTPSYNLNTLDITKKATLLFLIERNMSNFIISPFDQFAYSKLTNTKLEDRLQNIVSLDKYNSSKIKYLAQLLKQYDIDDDFYLSHNTLMPATIASKLNNVFFNIFSIGDLETMGKNTIRIFLNLRRGYTPQKYLDKSQLIANININIKWNYIALCKFKSPGFSITIRMGLFNYYLAQVYALTHMQARQKEPEAKLYLDQLKSGLSLLLSGLINNGLLTYTDIYAFKRFCAVKVEETVGMENAYYRNADMCVGRVESPLGLANLCRIKVKGSLTRYDHESLGGLNLSESVVRFLMFDDEMSCLLVN